MTKLTVEVDEDGAVRIGWGDPDWAGPGRAASPRPADAPTTVVARTSPDEATTPARPGAVVTVERPADDLAVLHLTAPAGLDGFASGTFAVPTTGLRFTPADRRPGGVPQGTRTFGFQYTEFALPVSGDADLRGHLLLPIRPDVVEPFGFVAPDGRTILLAPLDTFHDQVLALVDRHGPAPALAWGWHGDLDHVPAGFRSQLAVIAAPGPRAALDRLGQLLTTRHGTRRPSPERDALGRRLSYWTDNGSAYWYRTEGDRDLVASVADTVADLRQRGLAVEAVQLDSWFYPHEVLRPFDTDDAVVPPSGLVRWEPRLDVLPGGVDALAEAVGGAPLVAHCRHLSSASPYLARYDCWVDGDRAHPTGPDLYERWLDDARAWGVETFEHDWLVECFLGVRGLRERPGRVAAWQQGLDRAAGRRGMTLQWCMASPADLLATVDLEHVTSVRTCGDHGYLVGAGVLWTWFLMTNALARPLGLAPFKDVFHAEGAPRRHGELECLLAALSTGPVGIGDRLGRAEPALVRRAVRADGTIVRPDVPVAATDAAFARIPALEPVALVGSCHTDHPAGRWSYVVAANCHEAGDPLVAEVAPVDLGPPDQGGSAPSGPTLRWDWRTRTAEVVALDQRWAQPLDPMDWACWVLAPLLLDGRLALVGDVDLYATAGRNRLAHVSVDPAEGSVRATVTGPGETVTLTGWTAAGRPAATVWTPEGGERPIEVRPGAAAVGGGTTWSVAVEVPATTAAELRLRPA